MPLPVAFALAVAAHGGVFVVLAQARPDDGTLAASHGGNAPTDITALRNDEPEEVTLGIEADTPSSMTWIGFEEYEEHLARLSEVEQPALDETPSGGAGGTTPTDLVADQPPAPIGADATATAAAEAPSTPPTEMAEATDAGAAATSPDIDPDAAATTMEAMEAMKAAEAAEAATRATAAPPALSATETVSSATPPITDPDGALPLVAPTLPQPVGPWALARSTPEDAPPTEDDAAAAQPHASGAAGVAKDEGDGDADSAAEGEQPKPTASLDGTTTSKAADAASDKPASTQPSGASSPPSAPGPAGNRPNANGSQSDRESDPTSTVDVPPDQWKRGKPLAAHGIEIKTRRPVFPELTRLTSAPANPVVEILFDRNGVPRKARMLQSSGDPRVDGPVIDSLYRWRASGGTLKSLAEGETLRIEMRLLLGGE